MRRLQPVGWLVILACVGVAVADACPFCGAVGQPLASRRDAAFAVAVGEAAGPAALAASGTIEQPFVLHQRLAGEREILPGEQVLAVVPAMVTGTAAVFLTENAGPLGTGVHRAIAADETRLGYLAAAPAVDAAAARRLRWFVRWLEHPDPVLAEDAFAEFGQAPFEAVREAADALPAERLQAWVSDPGIVQQRRGFYGLALGLVAASRPQERDACLRGLYRSLEEPADDFRSGFDGILAGVLVAEGEAGLDRLIAMGLLEPTARPVEKRQMLSVLRFAWESLSQEIPPSRVSAATERLLESPVTAAEATVDLARYRAWQAVDRVAALWNELGGDDPLVRRAVAGYLSQCPLPEARRHADAIRSHDPELYGQALQASRLPLPR